MTLSHLFTIHSIIALANGLVFLVVPVEYLSIFGITISGSGTIFVCRLFAAALLTYGWWPGLPGRPGLPKHDGPFCWDTSSRLPLASSSP